MSQRGQRGRHASRGLLTAGYRLLSTSDSHRPARLAAVGAATVAPVWAGRRGFERAALGACAAAGRDLLALFDVAQGFVARRLRVALRRAAPPPRRARLVRLFRLLHRSPPSEKDSDRNQ